MSPLNIDVKSGLSQALIALREDKGLTQTEVAAALGTSRASVHRWETGRSTPDVENLASLAAVYDAPMARFFVNVESAIAEARSTLTTKTSKEG